MTRKGLQLQSMQGYSGKVSPTRLGKDPGRGFMLAVELTSQLFFCVLGALFWIHARTFWTVSGPFAAFHSSSTS